MYKLPKLPYLFQDLEPFIDTHAIGLHYHKHHKNYLNKLNELLNKSNYDYRYSLEKLVFHIDEFSLNLKEDILFNLGGVLNHNLYWEGISSCRQEPTGLLEIFITKEFGSFDGFWKLFKEKALELKGSGYTFLVVNSDGKLEIINVLNQDTPLLHGYIPLFTIDLWEHAYYLNYENERKRYLDNFFNIVDFTYASAVFNSIIKQ